ncbi:MAG: hypothetical protein Q4G70_08415 [Pseudomonadota bacterium]|nr:hypothetical protein [Pseudomonadota bacterium]
MNGRLSPRVTAGLVTLAIWALTAGSALFWGLRLGSGPQRPDAAVAGGPPAGGVAVDTQMVARALGARETAVATAAPAADVLNRLALRGIVTHDGRGAALIAIDGQAAKPVRVGAKLDGVEGDWTVRAVTPRVAVIAAGDREARLEMPPLDTRSTAGDAVAPPRPAPGAVPFVPGAQQQPQMPVQLQAPMQTPAGAQQPISGAMQAPMVVPPTLGGALQPHAFPAGQRLGGG